MRYLDYAHKEIMKKRLTKKQMIIFSLGQFGWSLLGGIISAWLVTFFMPSKVDAQQLGATQYIVNGLVIGGFLTIIGLITAVSRIFDAVSDEYWNSGLLVELKLSKKQETQEIEKQISYINTGNYTIIFY